VLRRLTFALAALLVSASTAHATSVSITVFTDITGQNTQIDQSHWSLWTFNVKSGYTVDDIIGSFVIKRGNSTNQPITFSLFGGDVSSWDLSQISTASALDSFSLNPADVTKQYKTQVFTLGPGLGLTDSSGLYSLALWSTTGTNGAFQYFFKGQDETLTVTPCAIAGDRIACTTTESLQEPPLVDENLPDPVPEPSTIFLTLSGLAALAVRRWRAA